MPPPRALKDLLKGAARGVPPPLRLLKLARTKKRPGSLARAISSSIFEAFAIIEYCRRNLMEICKVWESALLIAGTSASYPESTQPLSLSSALKVLSEFMAYGR